MKNQKKFRMSQLNASEIPNKNYVLVFFGKDNSYTVIDDTNSKLKNQSKAQVKFNDKWTTGEIKYRGKLENQ